MCHSKPWFPGEKICFRKKKVRVEKSHYHYPWFFMSVFDLTLYSYREDAYWYFIKKSCLNVLQETIWMCWWVKSFWHTDDDDGAKRLLESKSRYFKTYSSLLFDVVLFVKWWWFSCSRISKDCVWFFTRIRKLFSHVHVLQKTWN